jgi:tetratricopeptide (TPR) repeat protein
MVNNSHLIVALGFAVFPFNTNGLPHPELSATEILERQLKQGSPGSAAELTLHKSLGNLYKNDGHYDESISHYESARGLAAGLGDGEELVSTLQSLGLVKLRQGQLPDARAHLERAHALLDTQGIYAMEVTHNLGNVRRDMGHFAAALDLYTEAQKVGSSEISAEDGIPNLQVDMAEAFARRGDMDKALALLQQATKALSAVRDGSSDTSLAVSYSTLAAVHHAKGDFAHAQEFNAKALKIQSRALRSGHPDLVATMMRKSRLFRDIGDHDGAVKVASSAEEALRLAHDQGPDLISCLVWKSDLLREESRIDEAEIAIEEALAVQEHCCSGFNSPDAAVAIHTYGSILHDQGKLVEAAEKYEQALEMNLQTVGLEHPETAAAHNSLGTVYQDMGNDDKAEIHFTKCLEIQLQTVGTQSPEVSNTYNNLATILFRRGSLMDAKQLFEKALHVMDTAGVPLENPDRMVYAENLSEVTDKLQMLQGAEVI